MTIELAEKKPKIQIYLFNNRNTNSLEKEFLRLKVDRLLIFKIFA